MTLPPVLSSRRGFLTACASCAACAARPAVAAEAPAGKANVRVVFTHPRPDLEGWPYVNYKYEPRKAEVMKRLTGALPGIEFTSSTPMTLEEGKRLLEDDAGVDGYVFYMMGIPSPGVARALLSAGRSGVLVDDLYGGTGEFLGTYAWAKRNKMKAAGVSSTRFQDVVDAVRVYETIHKLKSSVILDVCEHRSETEPKAIHEGFGVEVRTTASDEINDAYQAADLGEADRWAKTWISNAQKVVEPTREEIGRSGRMYVAMRELMSRAKAHAIDIDCLRLFYGKKLPAYPCLGFFQLNSDGLVGACEADLQSTITMVTMSYLVGRPGFISDPVIDTSKNQIIYSHCVATAKVYGPQGKANPYIIRDHSEDRKGAAVESLMPLGELTSTLKFHPVRREVVFHQGKTVGHVEEDRACRTKLAVEVKDAEKMLTEWDRWGWHRVTYYGDWRKPVETFAALAGFQMVLEG
jgi:hypothetical protein